MKMGSEVYNPGFRIKEVTVVRVVNPNTKNVGHIIYQNLKGIQNSFLTQATNSEIQIQIFNFESF